MFQQFNADLNQLKCVLGQTVLQSTFSGFVLTFMDKEIQT